MRKTALAIATAGVFAVLAVTASGQDKTRSPWPPPPEQGWTREDARTEPHKPTLGYTMATVVKLSVRKTGRFIITLDNGQRWSQIENKPDVSVGVGDEIKLQKSSIGSYKLVTAQGVETRVRRDR
jgi:hypothetical protein